MTIDSRAFRNALGRFATGVCIVSTNDDAHGSQRVVGMTVNSFSALSLDPALVLWSIQKDSERYQAFCEGSGFGVSVLSEHQLELSNFYAQKDSHYLEQGCYRQGRSGQAVLRQCITSFECKMHQCIDGGDHTILVGEVIAMDNNPNGKPLVFYHGDYRQLR